MKLCQVGFPKAGRVPGAGKCWADELWKCDNFDATVCALSVLISSELSRSLVAAALMKRACALCLFLSWCSLPCHEILLTWLSPWSQAGAWRGHHVPGSQWWGQETEPRGPRCCPAEGP